MIQSVKLCYAVSLLILVQFSTKCLAFNVDTVNFVRHEGEPNSMFGFSVALHREQQLSWVIVGAPEAETSHYQTYVRKGGAVYRCDINRENKCEVIPFDQNGNQYNDRGEQIDNKTAQWFGATVASTGIDGPIVACAPRYVFYTMHPSKVERREPVGTCYTASNNFRVFKEYSPCRTSFWGYHKQGSCQAGMSAALTKSGDRLFIGAPGSWYWQGQGYSINTEAEYRYTPPRKVPFGEGQVYSHSLDTSQTKVYSTGESTSNEDDSYLGYSATTGDFTGDGSQGVAIGMPRGGELLGKVIIFSWNMTNQQNITGEQIGAYFGYSLCAVDVDGDKLDDLIVGAPMHTEKNNEGKYEMGRIYIIFQSKHDKFQMIETRDGVTSRARFGLALTSLNDINLDGFGDFAVGAPYDGPNGRGAVYIYHGSRNGPLAKHSQVIYAEDVSGTVLSTFGFSVSGGIDLDGNLYPDMVVGAYESNKVVVFKSRPVVVMAATTSFETTAKLISLDDKTCRTRGGSNVTCTGIHSCLKYTGTNLPQYIDIDVTWTLDSKVNRNPRMYFLNNEGRNTRNEAMRLYRSKEECRKERVYIVDNVRDKLTPLEVEMKYSLRNYEEPSEVRRGRRSVLLPVLDQNEGTVQRDSISIQKNCGPDNICIPDLRMTVNSVEKFTLGSEESLAFDVVVENYGEDAFEASFFMVFPEGLDLRKVDDRDSHISCTPPKPETNMTLKCDLGNPLAAGKSAKFKVLAIPSQKQGMAPSYDFYIEVNSTNPEVGTSFDNIISKSVTIDAETDLTITGKAVDAEIYYNISEYRNITNATKEYEIGPQLRNVYQISNGGPSVVEQAEIYILIPHLTLSGEHLMYIVGTPETQGNVKCYPGGFVNVLGLKLNDTKRNFLESIAGSKDTGVTGVSVEKSTSSGGDRSHTATVLTEAEHKKFDEEQFLESAGDASSVHQNRANAAANAHSASYTNQGGGSGKQEHSQTYSSSSWTHGNGPTTYTASRNRSSVQGEDGRTRYTEFSTENYRTSDNARSQSYTQQQNQRTNANSRTSSVGQQSGQAQFAGHANRGGSNRIDDIRTVEIVNPDISGLQSRTQTEGAVPTTGRRRLYSKQDGDSRTEFSGSTNNVDQGRNSFRTGTLDLGITGDNIGQVHRGGASQGNADNSYQQSRGSTHSQQFGGSTYSQQRGGSSSGYHGTHTASSGYSNQGQQAGGQHHYNQQFRSYESPHVDSTAGHHGYTNSMSGHNGDASLTQSEYEEEYADDAADDDYYETTDDFDPTQRTTQLHDDGLQSHDRLKRESLSLNDKLLEEALHCNSTQCAIIRCVAGPLPKGKEVLISIRTRLVAATLNKITATAPMNLSTMVVARVTQLPYIKEPLEQPIKRHEVVVTITPEVEPKPDVVPLWVWVLSACVGVLILLLLIYLLYKCGFFKRNRPTDSQERQPLNRNGAYHGDEHL